MEKKLEFYMTDALAADMDADKDFANTIGLIIYRFTCNDWGLMHRQEHVANMQALKEGGQVIGRYPTNKGYVLAITDDTLANPRVTTILYETEK